MKLTFKQRIIVLFTGELPEPLMAVDTAALKLDTTKLRPDNTTVAIPERHHMANTATKSAPQPHKKRKLAYEMPAKKCRQKPQQWQQVAVTPVRSTANALASKIRHGNNLAFKSRRDGHYEARMAPYMSEYLVEARFIPKTKNKENKK